MATGDSLHRTEPEPFDKTEAMPTPPALTGMPAPETDIKVTLRVVEGPHVGKEFTFAGHDTFLVGRSRRTHFRLPKMDRYFSRFHFMVEINPPHCRLIDMNSRNGTAINGQRVKIADLADGDEIRAGKTVLKVSLAHLDAAGPAWESTLTFHELASGQAAAEAAPRQRPPDTGPIPLTDEHECLLEGPTFAEGNLLEPELLTPRPPDPAWQEQVLPAGPLRLDATPPELPKLQPTPREPVPAVVPEPPGPKPTPTPTPALPDFELEFPGPEASQPVETGTPRPGQEPQEIRDVQEEPLLVEPPAPESGETPPPMLLDSPQSPTAYAPIFRQSAPDANEPPAPVLLPSGQTPTTYSPIFQQPEAGVTEPPAPVLLESGLTPTAYAPIFRPTTEKMPQAPFEAQPPALTATCKVCLAAFDACAPAHEVESLLCMPCFGVMRRQPQPIRGYRVLKPLGRGGMGMVYLALREADRTLVALKTITPANPGSKKDIERFLREANILRQLKHPNIVELRDTGESNGHLYFAMDYIRGTDGAKLLKTQGVVGIERAVGWICQLLDALQYAHGKGFVHRDIKPPNLMIREGGSGEQVILADFGLARTYQTSQMSGLTLQGDIGGTLAFMAPEQFLSFRESKPPADQFGAAATLYTLLTDRFLFPPQPTLQARLLQALSDEPTPIRQWRPEISEPLAAVIHRALAQDPEHRYPNVGAMRKALIPFSQ